MDTFDGQPADLVVVNSLGAVRRARTSALECFPDEAADQAADDASFEATLLYMWDTCRCGTYVCVRDFRVRCVVPFCNLDFRNSWSSQLTGDVPNREALPHDRWWCNADVLCTRAAGSRGWTVGALPTYVAMLTAALHRHPVQHAEFYLNRRDHPLVTKSGKHPYAHVWRGDPPIVLAAPTRLLPVLSPYTDTTAFHDRLIPTDTCWSQVPQG